MRYLLFTPCVKMLKWILALLCILLLIFPLNLSAGSGTPLKATMFNDAIPLSPAQEVDTQQNQTGFSIKKTRCLNTARWVGALGGSTMGILQIYWKLNNVSGVHGTLSANIVTAVPSMLIGGYVGSKVSEWSVKQYMKSGPKVGIGILKGMGYGALSGALTLTAGFIPLLIVGHYMGTIHFNEKEKDWLVFKLIGLSVLGGTMYGGLVGASIGAVAGPGISIYMNF